MNYDIELYINDGTEKLVGTKLINRAAVPWTITGTPATTVTGNGEYQIIAKLFETGGDDMLDDATSYILYKMTTAPNLFADNVLLPPSGGTIYKGQNMNMKLDFSSHLNVTTVSATKPSFGYIVGGTIADGMNDDAPGYVSRVYSTDNSNEIQDILIAGGVANPIADTLYSITSSWWDLTNLVTGLPHSNRVQKNHIFTYKVAQIAINSSIINVYSGNSISISGTITE